MEFLSNPYKLWASEKIEHQRAVLKLAFSDRLTYVRNQGYRTTKTTLPFKVLDGFLFFAKNEDLVPGAGLEPA